MAARAIGIDATVGGPGALAGRAVAGSVWGRIASAAELLVQVAPLVLVLGVVRLNRKLQVRPPVADGGGSAIAARPEVLEPIEQAVLAAVQVDPAARAHLFGPRPRLARHTGNTSIAGPVA